MLILKDMSLDKKVSIGIGACLIAIVVILFLLFTDGIYFHHAGYVKGHEKGLLDGIASVTQSSVPPDTIYIPYQVVKTVYKDRIVAQIETLYVNGNLHEIAKMDTVVTGKNFESETNIRYDTYTRLFGFRQSVNVHDSTKIVYYEKIIKPPPEIKTKTNWTATWMGSIIAAGTALFIEDKIRH